MSIAKLVPVFFTSFIVLSFSQIHGQSLCAEKVSPYGFACDEHTVTTEDGFILALQNIQSYESSSLTSSTTNSRRNLLWKDSKHRKKHHKGRKLLSSNNLGENSTAPSLTPALSPSTFSSAGIVLLLHPPLVAGDFWLDGFGNQGGNANQFLPFFLSQAGYDVWIGNFRATRWSHLNTHLNSDQREYWNWSWDELAQFDFPSLFSYVVRHSVSSVNSVHVIAYGISNAVSLAASSASADVASHLRSLIMIAPAVYLGNINSNVLRLWAWVTGPTIDTLAVESGVSNGAFNATGEQITENLLDTNSENGQNTLEDIFGRPCCIPQDGFNNFHFGNNGWDGVTAYKNLMHIQQMIRTNTFSRYIEDGQSSSQAYNPSNLPSSVRILLVYGGQDHIATPRNVDELASHLRTTPQRLYLPRYAHFDLGFSSTVQDDVFYPIIRFISGNE